MTMTRATPFAEITKRNMAMFEAAAKAFKPGSGPATATTPEPSAPGSKDDEIAALKAELARLQDKFEKLSG